MPGLAVQNVFSVISPSIVFYHAVILVVLIADVGPALLAITLSVLTVYLFLEPVGSIRISAWAASPQRALLGRKEREAPRDWVDCHKADRSFSIGVVAFGSNM